MRASQLFGGSRPPKAIINGFSTSGFTRVQFVNGFDTSIVNGKILLSGALVANTLKTVLSVSGGGVISFLAVSTALAGTRAVGLRLTLDGGIVFDSTSTSTIGVPTGFVAIGSAPPSGVAAPIGTDSVAFNISCLVEISSSLAETDSIATIIRYSTK